MTQPFSGIRVLDFTTVLAGPYCAYQMGLLGAEVIKVEPRGGETLRSRATGDLALSARGLSLSFLTQSANKRSMTLDVNTERGQALFRELAARCDVVVENRRTGSMDRRGIGYDAVRALHPDVVWCAISAYGRNGPKRRDPGYDSVLQAWSGFMSLNGFPGSAPLKTGAPVVDYATGLAAAYAVSAALLHRERGGTGQYIDVSLLDANLMLMSSVIVQLANGGVAPSQSGNEAGSGNPCSTTYDTGDGLLAIATSEVHQEEALLRHLDPAMASDARYANDAARRKYQMELRAGIQQCLRAKTAAGWETELNGIGVPAARVRTLAEAMDEPQTRERAFLHALPVSADLKRAVQVPLAPFRFAHDGPAVRQPPPLAGADTEDILRELGYDAAAIAALRADGVI